MNRSGTKARRHGGTQGNAAGAVQSVIRRIRKLMSYANDPAASPGEIENAMGHARRLMDQFHLDEAEVAAAQSMTSGDEITGAEFTNRRTRVDRPSRDLARVPCAVCDVHCCSQFRPSIDGRGKIEHLFYFGFSRDVAVAAELYRQLLIAMRARGRAKTGDTRGPAYRSFAAGFTVRLIQRAIEAKREASQSARFGAIVLARESRVERFLREDLAVKPAAPARRVKLKDGQAFVDGMIAAEGVSLGTNQIGPAAGRQRSLFTHGG
jgi:hypothetical protein